MLQALAIKYRPKTFDELIGQDTVSTSLKFALDNDRLAHAYLFSGLRGSGKTSSARIFSRALVCEKGPSSNPCGECPQCKSALEGRHIDIIEMDAASNRGLDDIQELIEQTKYAPSMARFKIFIIDEVHMLTPQAANALLKTLEEPPSYVKFILATTDPLKLPATVLSRTQHFRFKQIPQSEILKHLAFVLEKEGVSFDENALKMIARSGGGSLRDTLTLLDQAIVFCENNISSDKIASMLGFLDPDKIKEFYLCVLARDKDKMLDFLKDLQDYEASSVIDELLFYLKDSFFAKDKQFSLLIYERFFRILSRAKSMLAVCDDDSFVLCVMSFMMMEATYLREIDEEIENYKRQDVQKESKAQPISYTNDKKNSSKNPYELLLDSIYDRDFVLGDCFKKCTKFISFENNVLNISSNAKDEDRITLNNGFKLIQLILKELFGQGASIAVHKEKEIEFDKLQDIKQTNVKQDVLAKFDELKKDAKVYNPQQEAKETLDELFGTPQTE
ncbi:MAG TPA: DNA polymerase III subunit gamma/tau [Campylobacter avium]|uniref:DNA polymerase III subunit gamma/tau n=1 Tax=Campylobacter avium TaxID=522485 RepID=UPI001D4BA8F6|nr:DNA polymerase III subunit gamma/tau [Campylobacter avium]HJE65772.1 DNA polymerase III subunit gamma/tau [Campylobacter avium]